MQSLDYYLSRYWLENGDPRLHKSPLHLVSDGPWKMFAIVLTYLLVVTRFGPYMMRTRKPMTNLLWPIRGFNALMVVFNAYLFVRMGPMIDWGARSWGCGKSMQRFEQNDLIILELTLLSRYLDFFDSIFFVCRKKFDHLSVLHVAHHALVPIIVWFAIKTVATPFLVFAAFINFPIHVVMYSYYCLSTFPRLRKYLWWKKYLTSIQIIQFCIDLVHSLQVVYYPSCNYHWLAYVETMFSLSFLYLFCQFYFKSYTPGKHDHGKKMVAAGAAGESPVGSGAPLAPAGRPTGNKSLNSRHPKDGHRGAPNGLTKTTVPTSTTTSATTRQLCDQVPDKRLNKLAAEIKKLV